VLGDEYLAVTDLDAPRGRLVAIPMGSPTAADPASWRVLVPESEAVLRSVTPVGDLLYLTEFVDTYTRVRIVDRDGSEVGRVPLPDKGTVAEPTFQLMGLVPRGHPEEYLFAFSSPTESWGIYRHRPGAAGIETLKEPAVRLDAVVEDHWATSADGTRVPYHIVRRPDVPATTPQPTLVYGYGGYNAPAPPAFPRAAMAAFVDAGGVLVHTHLRGGADLGTDWWQGGRMSNKQNSYADLYAIAEALIGNGRTTADRLAVTGGSHGGLMSGVAITQRPELWRAAVPRVPRLDLLGSCREPYGRGSVTQDLGDPDDPDSVAFLATFSPYQLVRDGVAYPAVYLDVGDTDPRCPAWHGRKFAARLQEATSSDRPILLRVWDNVGHGWATAKDIAVSQDTGVLAFLLSELGMVEVASDEADG
jgi:prolyl oligopeptidase